MSEIQRNVVTGAEIAIMNASNLTPLVSNHSSIKRNQTRR